MLSLLNEFLSYLKEKKSFTAIMVAFSGLATLAQCVLFITFKLIGDFSKINDINRYIWFMGFLMSISMINYIAGYFVELYKSKVIIDSENRYKTQLIYKLLHIKYSEYEKHNSGEWLSRLYNDTDGFFEGLNNISSMLVMLPSGLIVIIISLVSDWRLTMSLLVLGGIQLIAREHLNKNLVINTSRLQKVLAGNLHIIVEILKGLLTARWLGKEAETFQKFSDTNYELYSNEVRKENVSNYLSMIDILFQYLNDIIFFALGFYLLEIKAVSMGSVLAIYSVKQSFKGPFDFVGPLMSLMKQSNVYMERLKETENIDLEISDDSISLGQIPESRNPGEPIIVMDGISYGYHKEPVLERINFKIYENDFITISGESGTGKTTLLKLLCKLYNPDEGSIQLYGKNISNVSSNAIRDWVTYIPQNYMLFNDTIKNNICMGTANVAEEAMVAAAKDAEIHEFIQILPEGYNTVLQDNGNNLSAGQRQRIAIARALLRNTPILLLDEISSSIDVETRYLIKESLRKLARHKTIIMVSHNDRVFDDATRELAL